MIQNQARFINPVTGILLSLLELFLECKIDLGRNENVVNLEGIQNYTYLYRPTCIVNEGHLSILPVHLILQVMYLILEKSFISLIWFVICHKCRPSILSK